MWKRLRNYGVSLLFPNECFSFLRMSIAIREFILNFRVLCSETLRSCFHRDHIRSISLRWAWRRNFRTKLTHLSTCCPTPTVCIVVRYKWGARKTIENINYHFHFIAWPVTTPTEAQHHIRAVKHARFGSYVWKMCRCLLSDRWLVDCLC